MKESYWDNVCFLIIVAMENMKKIGNVILYLLKTAWQFPQIFAAVVYYWYLEVNSKLLMTYEETDEYGIYVKSTSGSVTLGPYVFLSPTAGGRTLRHELGHVQQSLWLGPLYLIVVGLPSILWACLYKKLFHRKSYFWFYTEKWADKIMGINR